MLVGNAAPLTDAADEATDVPLAELEAPGNGVVSVKPLVVSTMIPRLDIAGQIRSSRKQSIRLGLSAHSRFIG
jgi:hypothetical protein